jgi:hypothetical protein
MLTPSVIDREETGPYHAFLWGGKNSRDREFLWATCQVLGIKRQLAMTIDFSTKKQIEDYVNQKVRTKPFSKETIEEALSLASRYDPNKVDEAIDVDKTIGLVNKIEDSITISKNLDKAAFALIRIAEGKILNMIVAKLKDHNKKCKKEDKIDLELIYSKIFTTKYRRARRYGIMSVARIPDAEKFSFLGIDKLIEISRVVKDSKSKEPIAELLKKCGYKFNLSEEESVEDLRLKINTIINLAKFNEVSLSPPADLLEQYTNKNGIVSDKAVETIADQVGQDMGKLYEAMLGKSTKKERGSEAQAEDNSSSFNEFESTAIKLTEIIEDILYYKTTPDYDPEFTKSIMYVLMKMEVDMLEFWKERWKDF